MKDLIARLEAATEGSRELSDEVLRAVGWFQTSEDAPGYPDGTLTAWHQPNGGVCHGAMPSPTESLDAALTLVPEAFRWGVHNDPEPAGEGNFRASVDDMLYDNSIYEEGLAATPALALTIAALRARECQ